MPNRIIKESICCSDSIKPLSWFEEVFFYRLIVNADDYGRLDARAEMLQAKLFPLRRDITDSTIVKALNALTAAGMVQTYEYDGRPLLQLTAWEQHQQIRAKRSKFPAPDNTCNQMISDDIKCPRNPIQSNPNLNPNPNPKESIVADAPQPHSKIKPQKHKRGIYGRVLLTDEEVERLYKDFGQDKADYFINFIDESAEGTENKNGWKSWNVVIRRAIKEGWGKYGQGQQPAGQNNKPATDWGLSVTRL